MSIIGVSKPLTTSVHVAFWQRYWQFYSMMNDRHMSKYITGAFSVEATFISDSMIVQAHSVVLSVYANSHKTTAKEG